METCPAGAATAPSHRVMRSVPIAWGKSELTRFLDVAESQMHATYVQLPQWFEALEGVDGALNEMAPAYFHEIDPPRQTSAKLFNRAFATYRAAARLAISGQLFEVTVLARSVLESCVYAWACGHSEAHRTAWERRSDGDDMRHAARRAFRWRELLDLLAHQNGDLAANVGILYEQLIDMGAHPNVEGVALSADVAEAGDGKMRIGTIHLHGDSEAIRLAILELLRATCLGYALLELIIGARLRILGVDRNIAVVFAGVSALIDEAERQEGA